MARIAPLEERVARYERIMAMRGPDPDKPRKSYDEIGASFDPPLSRERVRQIIDKPPKAPGRPAGPSRRETLRRKLAHWERRRSNGVNVAQADVRIAELSAELARLP